MNSYDARNGSLFKLSKGHISYLFCLMNTVAVGKAGVSALRGLVGVDGPGIQEAPAVLHSKREPLTSQRPNPEKGTTSLLKPKDCAAQPEIRIDLWSCWGSVIRMSTSYREIFSLHSC